MNTGGGLRISPIRFADTPALPGSLQNLRFFMSEMYQTTLTGPLLTRLERVERKSRERRNFPLRVYAITPPLALQWRTDPKDPTIACQVLRPFGRCDTSCHF